MRVKIQVIDPRGGEASRPRFDVVYRVAILQQELR